MIATGYFKGQANTPGAAAITSNTLAVIPGDYLTTVFVGEDNAETTAFTITNDGTAIIWTQRAATNVGSNTKVVMWSGTAGATPPTTVTVTATAGTLVIGSAKALFVGVHTGQHATTPLPAGNIFSGTGGTDVSQAITPSSDRSALWFVAGDWAATNSFAAIANCALVSAAFTDGARMTACAIRPTTQPRTDALAFTIGETDTAGTIAWVAFEVQAAPPNPMTFAQNRGIRPAPFRPGLARLTKAQKDRHNGPAYRTVLDRAA